MKWLLSDDFNPLQRNLILSNSPACIHPYVSSAKELTETNSAPSVDLDHVETKVYIFPSKKL